MSTTVLIDNKVQKNAHGKLKYQQLADHIVALIESEKLRIGDQIPSLKQLQQQLKMSKETLLKGLNELVEKGIIESVYRKGYFVRKKTINHNFRVFLLLDKMNILREQLYRNLFNHLQTRADIDIYFHHHNYHVFENLIKENVGLYTHYVIATFLKEDVAPLLNLIPEKKRIIIDLNQQGLMGSYSCIYQDYGHDIYHSLHKLKTELSKYERLILVAHSEAVHARLVIEGFLRYCTEMELPYLIQSEIGERTFQKGNAYVTFSRYDTDDVALIKLARKKKLKLGVDVGLISYNDTDVKEILENGITVISTDFEAMGKTVAQAILEDKIIVKRNPTKVIKRSSL
ncbi:GntR family transcriptional regulator [Niabella ginsengisoli]|uniref:GntR family transcriptional regulator n=1 Tax=Niabella ginsengisoli TaxID=522298 RepID=A0ABS9SJ64_9BACT|nr:GntR family transcriptional regulator [Niabella ginsengisoli]MCH5598411.1 GntR family transcriptional regulator [Niabella ginsengisoli]